MDAAGWWVRDVGSRNGTFVNGLRVSEAQLRDGDRIGLGPEGPVLEFRLADAARAAREPVRATAGSGPSPRRVERQNVWLRGAVVVLALALLVSIEYALWSAARSGSDWAQERAGLLARIDSVLAAGDGTVRALAGEREELAAALRQSQEEVTRVRRALESAGGQDATESEDLKRQLQSALASLSRQQLAAALDYGAVERAARRGVAVVWVETGDGQVVTGTAFAIAADATLVTARHILQSEDGRARPRRIAVQFSDSDQVWPARALSVSEDADVAILKVDNIEGGVVPVPPFNLRADTLGAGAPVAWIGFPLGGQSWPQDSRGPRLARPIGSVGVITRLEPDVLEIQGFGARGASGSPIFDRNGNVIAVLIGGRRADGNDLLVAVPASAAARLLESR